MTIPVSASGPALVSLSLSKAFLPPYFPYRISLCSPGSATQNNRYNAETRGLHTVANLPEALPGLSVSPKFAGHPASWRVNPLGKQTLVLFPTP